MIKRFENALNCVKDYTSQIFMATIIMMMIINFQRDCDLYSNKKSTDQNIWIRSGGGVICKWLFYCSISFALHSKRAKFHWL